MQGVKTLVECQWGDQVFGTDVCERLWQLYQGTHANMGHNGSLYHPFGLRVNLACLWFVHNTDQVKQDRRLMCAEWDPLHTNSTQE